MELLSQWNLPEIASWFSWVMVDVSSGKLFPRFPASDPSGPGVVILIDNAGVVVYRLDPMFWNQVAEILARYPSPLSGQPLAANFRAALEAL